MLVDSWDRHTPRISFPGGTLATRFQSERSLRKPPPDLQAATLPTEVQRRFQSECACGATAISCERCYRVIVRGGRLFTAVNAETTVTRTFQSENWPRATQHGASFLWLSKI